MPLQAGGRKIKTFTGTIVIKMTHKTNVRKKFVPSKRPKPKHSPSLCMSRPSSISLLLIPVEWFWVIQEGIDSECARYRYERDPNPSPVGGKCARESRQGSKGGGEGRTQTTQSGAQGGEGGKER